jgi:hypothetical protein
VTPREAAERVRNAAEALRAAFYPGDEVRGPLGSGDCRVDRDHDPRWLLELMRGWGETERRMWEHWRLELAELGVTPYELDPVFGEDAARPVGVAARRSRRAGWCCAAIDWEVDDEQWPVLVALAGLVERLRAGPPDRGRAEDRRPDYAAM